MKAKLILFFALCILTLSACDRTGPVPPSPSQQLVSPSSDNFPSPSQTDTPSSSVSPAPSMERKQFSSKEFSLLSLSIEDADAMFGTPRIKEEIIHEASEQGYDYEYDIIRTYDAAVFRFTCYERRKGDTPNVSIQHIIISTPDCSLYRNIKVGDTLESALSHFPDENSTVYTTDTGENARLLYGKYDGYLNLDNFGVVIYENNIPSYIRVGDGLRGMIIKANAEGIISEISISWLA